MKILITGGSGMVGHAFKTLETEHELIFIGSKHYNLTKDDSTSAMFTDHRPDAVIHLAAKVGGVKGNTDYIANFFEDNIRINTNVLSCAQKNKVPKVVSLLSTCVYPDIVKYPLTECQIHNGAPHESNFGYAYAKRMLDVHSRAIRQQYGLKYITAVPNNLYGPNDNYDLLNGHAVAAVIRKVHEAKLTNVPPVFWGSGRPYREFTYTEDVAKILLWMLENYDSPAPLNIGSTCQYRIKDLVNIVCELFEYTGRVCWDSSMPEGQYKKPSSNKDFRVLNPDFKFTSLRSGLIKNIDWYKENYPNVRGN